MLHHQTARTSNQQYSVMCTTMMKMVVDMKRSSVIVSGNSSDSVLNKSNLDQIAKAVNYSDSVLSGSDSALMATIVNSVIQCLVIVTWLK